MLHRNGMGEHAMHVAMAHMKGPENTLAMMVGEGPFGNLEMGGMFTVLKVRDHVAPDYRDPGWYAHPTVPSRGGSNRRVRSPQPNRLRCRRA
jgi:manganese oxidase